MHYLWPTGLLLSLITLLAGCAMHPAGQSHVIEPQVRGQAQCSGSDQSACSGQSLSKTSPDLQPSARTEFDGLFYFVDLDILDVNSQRFVDHTGDGKYESYLVQNIPFEPTEDLRKQVEIQYGFSLKHRGEAHITVVTPPEFERLSEYLTIEAVNEMAFESIQKLPYQLVCLGLGKVSANETLMFTFFAVVESRELTVLRNKIQTAYILAGGSAPAFMAPYRPHITIGFTHRDLHESDGVIKDATSCVSELVIGLSPAQ